jgi:hypothetical protein
LNPPQSPSLRRRASSLSSPSPRSPTVRVALPHYEIHPLLCATARARAAPHRCCAALLNRTGYATRSGSSRSKLWAARRERSNRAPGSHHRHRGCSPPPARALDMPPSCHTPHLRTIIDTDREAPSLPRSPLDSSPGPPQEVHGDGKSNIDEL